MKPDPIKAKIQELCPDVMELKFGCEFDFKMGEIKRGVILKRALTAKSETGTHLYLYKGTASYINERLFLNILGSPITLAVVLRAIEEHGLDDQAQYHQIMQDLLIKRMRLWNLEHDNYDQQSDECKQFIGSLLGV